MSSFGFALQEAIYDVLTDAAIASGRVYDAVPQTATFPYVEIGSKQAIPVDAGNDGGMAETVDIHVWSRYRGDKEAETIMSQIYDALHGVELAVTGRASALAWVENTRLMLDQDGITRHGVVTVTVTHRS